MILATSQNLCRGFIQTFKNDTFISKERCRSECAQTSFAQYFHNTMPPNNKREFMDNDDKSKDEGDDDLLLEETPSGDTNTGSNTSSDDNDSSSSWKPCLPLTGVHPVCSSPNRHNNAPKAQRQVPLTLNVGEDPTRLTE